MKAIVTMDIEKPTRFGRKVITETFNARKEVLESEVNICNMAHNIMSRFKTGSVVVVSNPHTDSFAYRGTIGKVVSVRNGKIIIKSDNGYFSTWKENELLYLHD